MAGRTRLCHGPGNDAVDDRRLERGAAAAHEPRIVDEQRDAAGLWRVRHGAGRDDPTATPAVSPGDAVAGGHARGPAVAAADGVGAAVGGGSGAEWGSG